MVFNIHGIRIKLCFSFVATITLMLTFSDTRLTLISFASSVAHETGHLLCLLLLGEKPKSISLGFFGMRMLCTAQNSLDAIREAVFLLSGAAVNIFISAVSAVLAVTGNGIFYQIFSVNAVIAVFNLLPVGCLDGGRALHIFLLATRCSEKSDNIILITSYLTVAFLVVFGIYLYLCRKLSLSYAAVTIYLTAQTVMFSGGLLRKGY